MHIIPAKAKKQTGLDDFAISKLPLKRQQQIKRRTEAASSTFNWNSLYMNVSFERNASLVTLTADVYNLRQML